MKKRLVIGGIILIGLITVALLLIPRRGPEPIEGEACRKPAGSVGLLYNKAQKFESDGDLLSAKKAYKKLLTEYPESNLIKDARGKLDELNMRILFSPIPTEDSVFYEVKPGDTLGKIAKEHGTTVELIMKSNNLANTAIKPMMRLKILTAKYGILVDKSQNILMLKGNNEILKTYTVSTGVNDSTPSGTYKIVNKLIDPTWYKAGAIVPSESPENILGSRWMGIDLPGYGIHGTTDETSLGQHITKGCIRMRNQDVEELYAIVPVGVEVTIID